MDIRQALARHHQEMQLDFGAEARRVSARWAQSMKAGICTVCTKGKTGKRRMHSSGTRRQRRRQAPRRGLAGDRTTSRPASEDDDVEDAASAFPKYGPASHTTPRPASDDDSVADAASGSPRWSGPGDVNAGTPQKAEGKRVRRTPSGDGGVPLPEPLKLSEAARSFCLGGAPTALPACGPSCIGEFAQRS